MTKWLPRTLAGRLIVGVGIVTILAASGLMVWLRANPSPSIIVGKVPLDDQPAALIADDNVAPRREPPAPPAPAGAGVGRGGGGAPRFSAPRVQGLWPPDGKPPGPARPFNDPVDRSGGLQFVLVLGSDARSGNPTNARADSIHVLALDPRALRGTIVGIPRDSYVDIPGFGRRKINDTLVLGGPELAVRTVRQLTGMPIEYYLLTAFEGFEAMVNEVGGIDAYVPYDMNEKNSGAFFQRGWHHMTGPKALSFSRNRHVPGGDLGRSENQGRLMLDALKKFRAESSTRREVEALVAVLARHIRVNMSVSDLVRLALLGRITADSDVRNVVAPGRAGNAGRASVVYLTDQAFALFQDVAHDAVVNGSYGAIGPPAPAPAEGSQPPPPPPPPPPEASPTPEPGPPLPLPLS